MEPEEQKQTLPSHWDRAWVSRRLEIERNRLGLHDDRGLTRSRRPWSYWMMKWGLKGAGLYSRGFRNFKEVRKVALPHFLPDWPSGLDGLRILQISDLHIDLDPSLLPVVCRLIQESSYDLAVITGDFWEGPQPNPHEAGVAMRQIRDVIGDPPFGLFGVLGNHDSLQLAGLVERLGIHILANSAVILGQGPSRFALAGVDDAYRFRTADVARAASQCPHTLPRILLSHSPQLAPEANEAGFSLMLSGHTHGGQICLPGGRSIITMEEIPVRLFRGPWKQGRLQGYTTTGTGACHVPVRFNCPPEIVIHTIHRPV